ncbi:MAG: class I SAM-dependent methyltransferase [Pseudomonadota bacterium]
MSDTDSHFDKVYAAETQEERDAVYTSWSATYEHDVMAAGYMTPARCAAALSRHAENLDIPILDIGCGTGLSGMAMTGSGFTTIDGSEINTEMRTIAEDRAIYRKLFAGDADNPFPFEPGAYDAITAVGVIGAGAAPLSLLQAAFDYLSPGALCVFSFNDHTLEDPSYKDFVEDQEKSGHLSILEDEHGLHLPGKDMGARVYVVRITE